MTTNAQITQVGVEAWVINTPVARVTHAGAEAWFANKSHLIVAQAGVEVWRSVASVSTSHLLFRGFP